MDVASIYMCVSSTGEHVIFNKYLQKATDTNISHVNQLCLLEKQL